MKGSFRALAQIARLKQQFPNFYDHGGALRKPFVFRGTSMYLTLTQPKFFNYLFSKDLIVYDYRLLYNAFCIIIYQYKFQNFFSPYKSNKNSFLNILTYLVQLNTLWEPGCR